jgi:hypothetical protein
VPASPVRIETLTHDEATRKNIPAGLINVRHHQQHHMM